jgi:porin
VLAAFNYAPDERVNELPYFFMTGLVLNGILPSRPNDYMAFGLAFGSYSSDLRSAQRAEAAMGAAVAIQHHEMTLEWTYGCHLMPGLLLQPDIQYIIDPGGDRSVANALAIGMNIVIHF